MLKKIDFGYIAPVDYLHMIPKTTKFHLILAHLLNNKKYVDFYNGEFDRGCYIILDNSAFEFKRPIEIDEILRLIDKSGIKVSCMVMPDYPNQPASKTLKSAEKSIAIVKSESRQYDIMVVPQSSRGDHWQWLNCYNEFLTWQEVKYIGMSILGIPNAFCSLTGTDSISFNRIFATSIIKQQNKCSDKKHHYLGMDEPRELIQQRALGLMDSNDSSSPVWHGILGIPYDSSVGGLKLGKSKVAVDFYTPIIEDNRHIISNNIQIVEGWLK